MARLQDVMTSVSAYVAGADAPDPLSYAIRSCIDTCLSSVIASIEVMDCVDAIERISDRFLSAPAADEVESVRQNLLSALIAFDDELRLCERRPR